MGKKSTTALMIFLFGVASAAANTLDVCASCHINATCDDKLDDSGKVCNCKYGFVGNGRSFCQDKDECQIGATKICGQHTKCHNTYGSYYCTCVAGYMASNNMPVFIPNDGTHCRDIDECNVVGICGEGGQCWNLDGSFDCSCQLGYQVRNGTEHFHPHKDKAFCQVVDCGLPTSQEDTILLSATGTTFGSVATFECGEGFRWRNGRNTSLCGADGLWRGLNMSCEAKCGPIPILAHSEVVLRNISVVIHRCANGYHSWRGSNVSTCSSSGVWRIATLKCIETKPPIHHLFVSNEKCLKWRAEKYDEDTETYKVSYIGSRDYERAFFEKRKRFLSSKADWPEVCLSLLPATNYSISITALSVGFMATITINTSLTGPAVPDVHYREYETPVPTLKLHRSPSTLDPISFYQVFVLPIEGVMVFDCSSPVDGEKSGSSQGHIAAEMRSRDVGTEFNFTVGDGHYYGGFFNAPLEKGRNYYIILRAVSQWKKDSKSSCVPWAKVTGTSYIVKIFSLCAAASVGVIALAVLLGYTYIWFFKKK
ncbi:sushi domain-containing protein 1 isoform X7 [Syngnathus typhle]|uniref:sushi domain-containing protein 1 isoform X7 n=1 Tax=Syngnathus typhle TaxID=161592 RepID=UPI002A699704|nr:sushi domain-containing protein 1 isoform X7 [Syngnathus typhle]